MKCLLDVGCNATMRGIEDGQQVFPDVVLSKWPVKCPAYKTGLRQLLKKSYRASPLRAKVKYNLLMHVHAMMSKKLGAATHRVSSTLAQLCWQKRHKRNNQ